MDRTGCELVEVIPGKVSGVPLVVGTRIPADFVLEDYEDGTPVGEILEGFPTLSRAVVEGLLRFAEQRRKISVA